MSFAAGLRHALQLRQEDMASELRRGDSLKEVLEKHLLAVEETSDDEILTSVLLLSSDGKHLTHGAAPSLPKVYMEAIDGAEIGPSAGSCGTAAYLGQPVYVTDIATDPLWASYRDLALPHGLRSCWSTPIRDARGSIMGTFAIYHRSLSGPTRDELDAIEVITDVVAEAITLARNPDASNRQLEILPKQVAALEALAAAIIQQAPKLDADGQRAIEAIVEHGRELAQAVARHSGVPSRSTESGIGA